jgi:ribose/xylose/arabinose/galactoside ABC-type transport system permease subunit
VFVFVAVVAALEVWLRHSRLGHETSLVGENRAAARAAALRVTRVTVVAFAIAGACAGIGGILIGASEGNATLLSGGDRYTYDAIAAVLVGGTLVTGGRGSAARTALGALFIATLSDMLLLRGYSAGAQVAVTGVVVLIVIVATQLRRGRR